MEGAPLLPAPLLATVSSSGGSFANVTVVGVVPAPPEAIFPIFSDPTRSGRGVFSDVKAVRELGRSKLRLHDRQLKQTVEVEQVARVQVLKVPVDAAMTVKLECNHSTKQVKLQLVKGNMLMRRYEGVYTIVPFSSGAQPALPPGLAETLGPATWRQLTAKLSEAALQPNASNSCGGGGGAGGSKAVQQQQRQQARRAQHSLVILHQRLQPALRPPPGLGGYVRGQVRKQFERMLGDLHRACERSGNSPAQPTMLQGLGSWLRGFPVRDITL